MADRQSSADISPGLTLTDNEAKPSRRRRVGFLNFTRRSVQAGTMSVSSESNEKNTHSREKATLGILADRETDEVPGTILLISQTRNEPLGYDQMEHHREDVDADARSRRSTRRGSITSKKRTPDGQIVLDPQPEDTPNDPLNWPAWRRDAALLSLGYYCMLGGGMTPILAAGFNNVAQTYEVSYSDVALTTGLYMMGLGIGSVIFSPTAILWGKRPIYLISSILFVLSAIWCALAPSYAQLVIARIFQGIAVSPVECLPSSTIAEIFFLHERAFRIGIYTLLLLGGKNLIPLMSAAVIQSLGWRWVFWIVAICVGLGGVLLFLFVPETFWDRTPRPKRRRRSRSISRSRTSFSSKVRETLKSSTGNKPVEGPLMPIPNSTTINDNEVSNEMTQVTSPINQPKVAHFSNDLESMRLEIPSGDASLHHNNIPHLHNLNSPFYSELERADDYFSKPPPLAVNSRSIEAVPHSGLDEPAVMSPGVRSNMSLTDTIYPGSASMMTLNDPKLIHYTTGLRNAPAQPWSKSLKPFNGRISRARWWRVACRPFVLYAYPSILWSSLVYSLSVGWLIVLSESMTDIYKNRASYNFNSIQTGLVYLSPFIGGVLGTAVAGRFSDVIVRYMSRRNGGVYEPEFRLVMAIPITISTAIGLMGFGWSAEERDNFMVPTIFFGIISFGCCVGSTTSITFCIDSYRQFAGEALVTLNVSKNILHGLIWSLFFPSWLQSDGPKTVFLAVGGIQIVCMLTSIPMYVYGKRTRMWTVRKKMMERL